MATTIVIVDGQSNLTVKYEERAAARSAFERVSQELSKGKPFITLQLLTINANEIKYIFIREEEE